MCSSCVESRDLKHAVDDEVEGVEEALMNRAYTISVEDNSRKRSNSHNHAK
jgi:hypothetical protein